MNSKNWDDGTPVDRGQDDSPRRKARGSQRDAALCRQAERVLTTELMDLPGVWINRIAPAPDASRLLVLIGLSGPDAADAQVAIVGRTARLRHAVAAAIVRKKAPELLFHFVYGEAR